jgi:integrase
MANRIPRKITTRKLLTVWVAYTAFRKTQISHSTIVTDYQKIERFLTSKLPDFDNATRIKKWICENYSGESARRMTMQLNAACEWGRLEGLIDYNPFDGLMRYFHAKPKERDIAAFDSIERESIICYFKKEDPHYAPWVEFLFLTGCRPSEASALRWLHVTPDLREIEFKVSRRPDSRREQKTKSGSRIFPVGDRLRFLLFSLKTGKESDDSLLFTGIKGDALNYNNFQTKRWTPALTDLKENGLVRRTLSQYHCRHTWITLALENGYSIADVAYLSGNTPNIIHLHYASRNRSLKPPNF